jgi:hypothetical protein
MAAQVCVIPLIDWNDKLRKFIASLLLATTLSGCGYQGWVRYPCQEFENWEKAKCQPPQCEAIGQCTKDLLPEVDTANG